MLPKMLHIIERLPTVRIIADIVLTALRIVDMKMRCQIALPRECSTCFPTNSKYLLQPGCGQWYGFLLFLYFMGQSSTYDSADSASMVATPFWSICCSVRSYWWSNAMMYCLSRCRKDLYRLIHQIEGFFHIPIVRLKQQLRDLCFTPSSPSPGLYFAPEMPFSTRESSCNLHFQ